MAPLSAALAGLPDFSGLPIQVSFSNSLRISGGKLIDAAGRGAEVHAATFLDRRCMILERELLHSPVELRRILTHELFHFVWPRLGNPLRRQWEALLAGEYRSRAQGELGWSAQWRREALAPSDLLRRSRRWREYNCESFCDTAAWFFSDRSNAEYTLAPQFRLKRQSWFATLATRSLSI